MGSDTPNFDSLALAYRWMEYFSFGRTLERCRFHFLSRCSQARHALVLGDGDGRFTTRLLAVNPTITVDAIDASPAMLAVLRERAQKSSVDADSRLQTIQADLRQFTPPRHEYDLVVSHFVLDCLTDGEVTALIARLSPCMTQDAIWLVSEFAIPESGWLRFGAQIVIRSLYFAFSILTGLHVRRIPDYGGAFDANGFSSRRKLSIWVECWSPRYGNGGRASIFTYSSARTATIRMIRAPISRHLCDAFAPAASKHAVPPILRNFLWVWLGANDVSSQSERLQ